MKLLAGNIFSDCLTDELERLVKYRHPSAPPGAPSLARHRSVTFAAAGFGEVREETSETTRRRRGEEVRQRRTWRRERRRGRRDEPLSPLVVKVLNITGLRNGRRRPGGVVITPLISPPGGRGRGAGGARRKLEDLPH